MQQYCLTVQFQKAAPVFFLWDEGMGPWERGRAELVADAKGMVARGGPEPVAAYFEAWQGGKWQRTNDTPEDLVPPRFAPGGAAPS